jgi:hypothetical protein
MSVSDFEDKILAYVWRALVLAGLLTVMGQAFVPSRPPAQGKALGTSEVANSARSASDTNAAR